MFIRRSVKISVILNDTDVDKSRSTTLMAYLGSCEADNHPVSDGSMAFGLKY